MRTETDKDLQIKGLYRKAVESALDDAETRKNLEEHEAERRDVSVEKIRADLFDTQREALVLEHVEVMRSGWQEAVERLEEARIARRKRIGKGIRWLLAVAGVLVTLAAMGAFLLQLQYRQAWVVAAYALLLPLMSVYFQQINFRIDARRRDREEARIRFEQALKTQAIIAVREAVNHRLTSFSTTFEIFDQRGLRQLADPDRDVPTAAVEELEGLIESLDSGSIGLSGPRGSGKTTLIKSVTQGRSMPFSKERLGLVVAAPVKYDPREFVLHLFASLCEAVLSGQAGGLAGPASHQTRARRKQLMYWSAGVALMLAVAGLLLTFGWPSPSSKTLAIIAFALALGAAYIWFALWFAMTSPGRWVDKKLSPYFGREGSAARKSAAEGMAKAYLKQIRYQLSQDKSGSAKISLFGFDIGGSSTTTLTRSAWTLPEAVEEFRRFAGSLSNHFVVIGIDELDKMESDKAAREFLNNIKGVFGVPGCYYLVSVSEDAMSAFERRGLPLRDVFDSSFDEIQRVGYLTLAESRRVLESRVTGLPVPFQCLCHCLAGGLPRDLIRVTRELVHERKAAARRAEKENKAFDPSVASLARLVIKAELRGKLAAATASGRSSGQSQPWWLTRWLYEQDQASLESEGLRDRTVRFGESMGSRWNQDADDDKAQRIATEMIVFNYYAATILDLFGLSYITTILQNPEKAKELDIGGVWTIETLAACRQRFSVDPWLSWDLIELVRTNVGLTLWQNLRPEPSQQDVGQNI